MGWIRVYKPRIEINSIMARPLTKLGELKKTLNSIALPTQDVNEILDKCIKELLARTPTSPPQTPETPEVA